LPSAAAKAVGEGGANLMAVPRDNPDEYGRLKRFPPGLFETMVDWTRTQPRWRAARQKPDLPGCAV